MAYRTSNAAVSVHWFMNEVCGTNLCELVDPLPLSMHMRSLGVFVVKTIIGMVLLSDTTLQESILKIKLRNVEHSYQSFCFWSQWILVQNASSCKMFMLVSRVHYNQLHSHIYVLMYLLYINQGLEIVPSSWSEVCCACSLLWWFCHSRSGLDKIIAYS